MSLQSQFDKEAINMLPMVGKAIKEASHFDANQISHKTIQIVSNLTKPLIDMSEDQVKGIDRDLIILFKSKGWIGLNIDDIQAGLQKGVYVSTGDELIENRKDLDDSDLSWSVDFSLHKYWITTDDGADPIGFDTLEEIKDQHYYRGE
jgi:hypothetical protein